MIQPQNITGIFYNLPFPVQSSVNPADVCISCFQLRSRQSDLSSWVIQSIPKLRGQTFHRNSVSARSSSSCLAIGFIWSYLVLVVQLQLTVDTFRCLDQEEGVAAEAEDPDYEEDQEGDSEEGKSQFISNLCFKHLFLKHASVISTYCTAIFTIR